jgi:heat shock protein HtpX
VTAARNIYEQQVYNKRKTAIIVILYIAVLAFMGYAIDVFLLGLPNANLPVPLMTIFTLGVATGLAIWSLSSGWETVLKSTGAVPVNPNDPLQKQLLNVVEEMKIAAGLPMPKVYVIPDYDSNALAAGRDPHHCAIAVTDSLLKDVDRDELQGVIAHEMSHIRNYDILLMTMIASLVGAVVLIGDSITESLKRGIESSVYDAPDGEKGGEWILMIPLYIISWLLGVVLAPMILKVMAMGVSRSREYLADASGAELTRNPAGLARALKKIGCDRIPTFSIKRATAHICIVDPTGSGFNDQEGWIAEVFGTHPPVLKRIKRLEAMAYHFWPQVPHVSQVPH